MFALRRKFEFIGCKKNENFVITKFFFRNPVRTWRCEIFLSDRWQLLTWSIYHQVVVCLFSYGWKVLLRNAFIALFCRLLIMQNLFIVLVARIRLLWILQALIQLSWEYAAIAVVFTRTGYFLALQNLGLKSISTSAIFVRPCSIEICEWLESHYDLLLLLCRSI